MIYKTRLQDISRPFKLQGLYLLLVVKKSALPSSYLCKRVSCFHLQLVKEIQLRIIRRRIEESHRRYSIIRTTIFRYQDEETESHVGINNPSNLITSP